MSDASIENVINRYRDVQREDGNLELELRLKSINKEIFVTLIKALKASPNFKFDNIQHSVNIITPDNVFTKNELRVSKIRQQIFENSAAKTKISDTKTKKSSLIRPIRMNDYINYTINLSREQQLFEMINSRGSQVASDSRNVFQTSQDADIRIKIRISFLSADSQWRIDLTAIRSAKLMDIKDSLKTILNDMFNPKTEENFLESIDYMQVTSLEAEVEHVGSKELLKAESISTIMQSIFALISNDYSAEKVIHEEVAHVAEQILINREHVSYYQQGTYGMKRLLNQAISLTCKTYSEIWPHIDGKFITEKANGIRCLISISGNRCRLITDRLTELFIPSSTQYIPGKVTIADAELIVLSLDKTDPTSYAQVLILIFDVMVFEGTSITNTPFESRIEYLAPVATAVSAYLNNQSQCMPKKFVKLSKDKLKEQYLSVWKAKYSYEIDGIMIVNADIASSAPTHNNMNAFPTANLSNNYFNTLWYKWKPIEENTIDFLLVAADNKLFGIAPFIKKPGFDLYILFVGIAEEMHKKLGLTLIPKYDHIFPSVRHNIRQNQNHDHAYMPIQFTPSANPSDYIYYHPTGKLIEGTTEEEATSNLNMKIVEMRKKSGQIEDDWVVTRIRHDRQVDSNYFGNDYRTAEMNYQNYINPLLFENLYDGKALGYFTSTATSEYKAKNGFHRFVIGNTIKHYTTDLAPEAAPVPLTDVLSGYNGKPARVATALVVDLASGRGADLHRYEECGVLRTLFVDIDKNALTELIQRKFSLIYNAKKQFIIEKNVKQMNLDARKRTGVTGMTVNIMSADLTTDWKTLLERMKHFNISNGEVDYVNMSFAIHYFCDTPAHLVNLLQLISNLLKIGGYFSVTVMNGQRVFDLLSQMKQNDTWMLNDDNSDQIHTKYKIKKLYAGKTLAETGQSISIALPFADEMYEESLCNIAYLIKQCALVGLKLDLNEPFDKYLGEFQDVNRVMYNQITPADKQYIALHQVIGFKRVVSQLSARASVAQ